MYVMMIIAHVYLTGKFPFFVGCKNKGSMLLIWPTVGIILAFWISHELYNFKIKIKDVNKMIMVMVVINFQMRNN
jgi:hypothetical protein